MQNKYVLYTEMADEKCKEITSSEDKWIDFLNSASYHYTYNFNEQILIYAQRPDATACTTINIWNKNFKRWVKKYSKGIGILSKSDSGVIVKYLFDVSDTYTNYGKSFNLWKIKDTYNNGIIETLENNFGELNIKEDLAQAIFSASQNLAQDNFKDIYEELKDCELNLFDNISEDEKEIKILNLISDSVTYIVMKRCGINPFDYLEIKDFNLIKNFNTSKLAMRIGANISDIAKQELVKIRESVKEFEKNEKRTFEIKEKLNYNKNESKERIDENERNKLSNAGGLPNSTNSTSRSSETELENGKIFKNEREILEGTQERSISRINNKWEIGQTSSRDTRNSREKREDDNTRTSREMSSRRENESTRPDGLDKTNEQLQKSSRRDNKGRNDLQLDLFNMYVPPADNLPSVEEQVENIKKETEVNENTSAFFDFNQDVIDTALLNGSGYVEGKFRINKHFKDSLSTSENITFLKNEYGIGGGTTIGGNYEEIGYEYSSKGITLYKGYKDNAPKIILSWNKVEERINELVNEDKYLNESEKQEYDKWLNNSVSNLEYSQDGTEDKSIDIINLEKNYKLPDGRYFHFHTNDEGYYYDIYDKSGVAIDGGLLEFSDNEENETLMTIRKRLADFTDIKELADENLEEVSQDFINEITSEQKSQNIEKDKQETINNEVDAVNDENAELKIGDIIYLEDDRKYRVDRIDKENDQINLFDLTTFERTNYPFSRETRYSRALILYKYNPRNLKKEIEDKSIANTDNKVIQDKVNYHINNNSLGEGTPREKIKRNIDAIRVLKKIEEEDRFATPEEQEVLSNYIGWGGLPDVFKEDNSFYNELKDLLTEEEYESAMNSTLNSFYTPPIVIKSMYKVLENMGFTTGNMLEPSCRSR